MIARWRQVVKRHDQVLHLGDLSRGDPRQLQEVSEQLPGEKYIILGNHDEYSRSFYQEIGFIPIKPFSLQWGEWEVFFDHHPRPQWVRGKSRLQVHGHVHGRQIGHPHLINACVEQLDFRPQRLEELLGARLQLLDGQSALQEQHLDQDPLTGARLGVSTGTWDDLRGCWKELCQRAYAVSPQVIELSAMHARELPDLVRFLRRRQPPFDYISLHAPARGPLRDERLVSLLESLPAWVRTISVHPDVINDPRPWQRLGPRLALENLDARKKSARDVSEMLAWFERLPQAGLCLDFAHAHTIDPSGGLSSELLDAFGRRLRQVHLSQLDTSGRHIPAQSATLERWAPLLARCRGVPWILEAGRAQAELPSRALPLLAARPAEEGQD